MALKAGYYGVKKQILDELAMLNGILPAGVSSNNKVAVQSEINDIWKSNKLTGAHNLNGTTYIPKTEYNVTWTFTDGVLEADASDPASNNSQIGTSFVAPFDAQVIASGCNSGDAGINMYPWDITLNSRPYKDSSLTEKLTSNDNIYDGNELSFYMQKGHSITLAARVTTGKTPEHVKFYPMIRLAGDQNDEYSPYTLTNQEISTDINNIKGSLADQKDTINAIISAATGAADFAAFKTAMEAITPVTRAMQASSPDTREITDEPVVEKTTTKRAKKTTKVEEE